MPRRSYGRQLIAVAEEWRYLFSSFFCLLKWPKGGIVLFLEEKRIESVGHTSLHV